MASVIFAVFCKQQCAAAPHPKTKPPPGPSVERCWHLSHRVQSSLAAAPRSLPGSLLELETKDMTLPSKTNPNPQPPQQPRFLHCFSEVPLLRFNPGREIFVFKHSKSALWPLPQKERMKNPCVSDTPPSLCNNKCPGCSAAVTAQNTPSHFLIYFKY